MSAGLQEGQRSVLLPPALEASSIGSTARARLDQGRAGTIESLFDGAINIWFPGGLVCVVSEAVGRGSLNINVRLPISTKLTSLGVTSGDVVRPRGAKVDLGEVQISLASSAVYPGKVSSVQSMLSDGEIGLNLEIARKTALERGRMGGLGGLLASAGTETVRTDIRNLNVFARYALPRLARLESAFGSGERGSLVEAVGELIGLGPGLTPSSDDMLAGLVLLTLLYAENHRRLRLASRALARAIATQATGRTTRLSEEFLQEAVKGRANEPVASLCAAVLGGCSVSVERETCRVLRIGESSGTDIVLGVVLGGLLCTGRQLYLEGPK